MSITCAQLARLLFAGTCVHLVYRVVQLDPNPFSWVLQLPQLMFENRTSSPRRRLAIESSNWNKNIMIPRRKCLWDQPFPGAFNGPHWLHFVIFNLLSVSHTESFQKLFILILQIFTCANEDPHSMYPHGCKQGHLSSYQYGRKCSVFFCYWVPHAKLHSSLTNLSSSHIHTKSQPNLQLQLGWVSFSFI